MSPKFPYETVPWPVSGLRRASVNSFGFGGANSHVVLDDVQSYLKLRGMTGKHYTTITLPASTNGVSLDNENLDRRYAVSAYTNGVSTKGCVNGLHPEPATLLVVLSASERAGMDRLLSAYEEYLQGRDGSSSDERFLEDLAFTLAKKRSRLPWKSFAIASSIDSLKAPLTECFTEPVRSADVPNLGFVFTGQGAQWWGMGRELFKYRVFEESLLSTDRYLQQLGCSWSLCGKFYDAEGQI